MRVWCVLLAICQKGCRCRCGGLRGRLFVMRGYGHLCQHSHNSGELFIHQHFGISVFRLFAKWPTSFGAKTIPLPLPLGFHKCYVSVVIALYCGWILCKYQHVLCHKCLDFPGNTNYTESELYFELLVGEIDMIKWFLCFKLCSKFVQLLNYLVNPLVFVWFISFIFEIEFKSGYTYQIWTSLLNFKCSFFSVKYLFFYIYNLYYGMCYVIVF